MPRFITLISRNKSSQWYLNRWFISSRLSLLIIPLEKENSNIAKLVSFFCYPAELHFCGLFVFKNLHLLPFRLPRQQSSMETTDRNEMWCANRCTYCILAVHVVINSPERITTINSITLEENEIGGPKDEHKFVWVSMDHFGLFRIEFKSVPYSPGND